MYHFGMLDEEEDDAVLEVLEDGGVGEGAPALFVLELGLGVGLRVGRNVNLTVGSKVSSSGSPSISSPSPVSALVLLLPALLVPPSLPP